MNACEVLTQFSVSSSPSLLPIIPSLWFSSGAFVVLCGSSTLNCLSLKQVVLYRDQMASSMATANSRSTATVVVSDRAVARKSKG